MEPGIDPKLVDAQTADVPRRSRRSRDEIRQLIVTAARAAFAERGYAGATTRDIAARADCSETLVFRYFETKTRLFEDAVFTPFDTLIGEFLEASTSETLDRQAGNEVFVRSIYMFLKDNADLLRALAKSPVDAGGDNGPMHGLDNYFRRAAERLQLQYRLEGAEADVPPRLSVRFGFGMVAAAILFEDWFFPDDTTDEHAATEALTRMMFKALSPTSRSI
jgi:AcrR family transcriptional regulator